MNAEHANGFVELDLLSPDVGDAFIGQPLNDIAGCHGTKESIVLTTGLGTVTLNPCIRSAKLAAISR